VVYHHGSPRETPARELAYWRRGGETLAISSPLINTCKLNEIDPQEYLTDVLERIVSGGTKINRLHELLLWEWKRAREATELKDAA